MNLDNKTNRVWDNAKDCDCVDQDCYQNHKLCGWCGGSVTYTAHESNQPNSKYVWNIDHIISKANGGTNHISNLQVVHVFCNRYKGSRY